MKYLIQFLIVLVFLSSCDDDPKEPQLTLPSNVSLEISKSASVEGRIDVKAKADNENYFTIHFEDGDMSETIEDKNGIADHTYSKAGIYTITTRAHATGDRFTEITDTVHILIDDPLDQNGIPTQGYSTPMSYDNLTMVWNDEFDGTSLNEVDWNYEIGTGSNGWGNAELQYYLKENTSVANGYLTITAKEQQYNGSAYTSSRLTTEGKKSFKYGRIDIRAALPKGQGMWPALWMLGDNIRTVSWPACGEIDIMELVGGSSNGKSDSRVYGTIHWDQNGEHANYGGNRSISDGDFSEKFHVFSIIWDENEIKWLLDDVRFHSVDITPANLSELNEKMFFIFNIAVGGNWPGSPDATTTFPQKMHVDYIRVFQ